MSNTFSLSPRSLEPRVGDRSANRKTAEQPAQGNDCEWREVLWACRGPTQRGPWERGEKGSPLWVGRRDWSETFGRGQRIRCLGREIYRELCFSVSDALSDNDMLVYSCVYLGCSVGFHCSFFLFNFFHPKL